MQRTNRVKIARETTRIRATTYSYVGYNDVLDRSK